MKGLLIGLAAACCLLSWAPSTHAQQQQILCAPATPCSPSTGPSNTSTGDPLWKAGGKMNANEGQLYNMFGSGAHLATAGSATSGDIIGLWTGTCTPSVSIVLTTAGSCQPLGGGSVTITGSPANGNMVKWSGAASITNGDLSGDCTTSGALAITCTKTSGTVFGTFATQNYATPPPIGGTTPAAGSFTTVTATTPIVASSGGTGVNNSKTITVNGNNAVLNMPPSGNVGTLEIVSCTAASNSVGACPLTSSAGLLLPAGGQSVILNCTSACTITVPANFSVPYPIGTCIDFYAEGTSANVTLAVTTDTLTMLTTGLNAPRVINPNGEIVICKYDATHWRGNGQNFTYLFAFERDELWG